MDGERICAHVDPEIAKYPREGGNSVSVRNVELMAQCSDCLFEGWNETYADPFITSYYTHYKLHVITHITCNCMHYIKLHFVT